MNSLLLIAEGRFHDGAIATVSIVLVCTLVYAYNTTSYTTTASHSNKTSSSSGSSSSSSSSSSAAGIRVTMTATTKDDMNANLLTRSSSESSLSSNITASSSSSSSSLSSSSLSSSSLSSSSPPPNDVDIGGIIAGEKSSSTTKNSTKEKRMITWKELKSHSKSNISTENDSNSNDDDSDSDNDNDIWIAINGHVYDITKFATHHPGGQHIITDYAGRDATDEFEAFHLPRVKRRLLAFEIGILDATTAPNVLPATRDYRALRSKLWEEGWFDADLSFYIMKDILALSILLTGVGFVVLGDSILTRAIAGGSFVGLALQQIAFVAHDAGHRGIAPPPSGGGINWLGWFHGVICFGVSIEMWVDEHSAHHAYTMRPHEDPQFKYLPIFLVSPKELTSDDYDTKVSKVEHYIATWLVPIQHYTLIPISVIIGRFNLHIISMIYAIKHKAYHDVIGLCLYMMWFGSIVNLLPTTETIQSDPSSISSTFNHYFFNKFYGERILFVLVAYIVAGILHVQLTISHLATDSFTAEEDEQEQFFAFQCKTTRNISTSRKYYNYEDWFHGGLQYQIEHHLFPQLPRHNLHKVQPLVKELCHRHNIPYRSKPFFGAIAECLSDMKRLSSFLGDLTHPHEIMAE